MNDLQTNKLNQSIVSAKPRESQFELLRIFAMLMITIGHFLIRTDTCGYTSPYQNNISSVIGISLLSFFIIGVNVFVLISGYFGIKHITKSILRLVVDCVLFGSVAYIFAQTVFPASALSCGFKSFLHCINFRGWWFIFDYILLVMISPMLERILKDISFVSLSKYIILLTIVNIWGGYLCQHINSNGFNYLNFIYLYIIARYLRLAREKKVILHLQKYGLLYWIICCALMVSLFELAFALRGKAINSNLWWGYNNPIVIVSSICFFCYFMKRKFFNKYVNILASGMLGVYLLHAGPSIIWFWNSGIIKTLYQNNGYILVVGLACFVFLICVLLSLIINYVVNACGLQFTINTLSNKISRITLKFLK